MRKIANLSSEHQRIGKIKGIVRWRKGGRGVCADLLIVGGRDIPAADVRKSP